MTDQLPTLILSTVYLASSSVNPPTNIMLMYNDIVAILTTMMCDIQKMTIYCDINDGDMIFLYHDIVADTKCNILE